MGCWGGLGRGEFEAETFPQPYLLGLFGDLKLGRGSLERIPLPHLGFSGLGDFGVAGGVGMRWGRSGVILLPHLGSLGLPDNLRLGIQQSGTVPIPHLGVLGLFGDLVMMRRGRRGIVPHSRGGLLGLSWGLGEGGGVW